VRSTGRRNTKGNGVVMARTQRNLSVPSTMRLWELWMSGEPLIRVAAALEMKTTSVSMRIVRAGGVAPRHGARNPTSLSDNEREEISRALADRWSFRRIAAKLNRSPSTISREVIETVGVMRTAH
jgi:DNA-binding NarL/FixJ family response regulator